jgi:hypothetical protein
MIVEIGLLLYAAGSLLKVPKITKVIGAKKVINRLRKTTRINNITINVDEFINDNGKKVIEFSILEDELGRPIVLTQAETLMFQQQQLIEFLLKNGISPNKKEDWEKLINSLLECVERRRQEVLRSPGRRGRK